MFAAYCTVAYEGCAEPIRAFLGLVRVTIVIVAFWELVRHEWPG